MPGSRSPDPPAEPTADPARPRLWRAAPGGAVASHPLVTLRARGLAPGDRVPVSRLDHRGGRGTAETRV